MDPYSIRPFHAERDLDPVYAIWQAALPSWPISREALGAALTVSPAYQVGDHLVAYDDFGLLGFAASHRDRPDSKDAYLSAVVVHPDRHGQGIGRALHDSLLWDLAERGILSVQLGGGQHRFWPGVPEALPGAQPFFEACGWTFTEACIDLLRRLQTFHMPPRVLENARGAGFVVRASTRADARDVLTFVTRHFTWLDDYRRAVEGRDYEDILAMRYRDGQIAGAALLSTTQSRSHRPELLWKQILGPQMGGITCVGVAAAYRGRGLGLALIARAAQLLHARGVSACYAGPATEPRFFGHLGFRPWRRYLIARREFAKR